jgi:hypothetical protein
MRPKRGVSPMKIVMRFLATCSLGVSVSACNASIGSAPPVDPREISRCSAFLDGSSFDFPFFGPSIGAIAPGNIPEETKIRFGLHLAPGSSVRFLSTRFELYAPDVTVPKSEKAEIFGPNSLIPTDAAVAAAFEREGIVRNTSTEEQMYLLRVFAVEDLPEAFLIRVPQVEVWGIPFQVPDFKFKHFTERKGLSLCAD